ncbi:bifunctional aminoglycoside phosphotransferase/ATP-binding protein [Sphingomonas qomolangmaensis]|uniref:AAA family ATPase n=1 Tax=Sphingomonas qomolangmaensis TaxID=2918765 RepID=A0ABY5LAI1_9SPHN|nr:bifunctional aminoglycoside phosphotransferase/ATP-binding protein [Sphingomonas qomolangmaensis]UUL83151.1 AAA family ATPase [Sphingomonas qomolangmaensis]
MPHAQPAASRAPAADIGALLQSGAFGEGAAVRRIDTHAASVFLTHDRAWKLKQPVRFDYLDFSTAPLRKAALEAELRLNRRLAPDLYLAVHPITREGEGTLAIDGAGEAVDWLLEMRRFDDDALLDDRARQGPIDPGLMARLAEHVHAFHAAAAISADPAGAPRIERVIAGNAAALDRYPGAFDRTEVTSLLSAQRSALCKVADRLDARARRGRVRHGHGDLHLANVAMIDGEPTPFDCLEFDPELATIDTLYDLAFLLMDLWHRGQADAANALYNRYCDLSGDDADGIAAMPLFLSLRATIRAHVAAARSERSAGEDDRALARDYLRLAASFLAPAVPRLVAIGGRSGTGKSTVARGLGGSIGAAPGARILRSDVLRKRIAGVAPETPLPADHYTPDSAAAVYRALGIRAQALLAEGASVIADAAFLLPAERQAVRAVATEAGVAFNGLWLEASEAVRIERVTARRGDASDADARVARIQSRRAIGSLGTWRRIAAGGPAHSVVGAALATLQAPPAGR